MIPKRLVTVSSVLLVLLCARVGAVPADGLSAGKAAKISQENFLGFQPGEEIRYILERIDGGRHEWLTMWSIRLEESDGETGVFELTHEVGRLRAFSGSEGQQGAVLLSFTAATAWVNASGFPTRVNFTTRRMTAAGGIEYSVEYRYQDRGFIKELHGSGKDQEVALDDYAIDLGTPAGLFLFMPVSGECVSAARQFRGVGDSGPGGAQAAGGSAGDETSEPPCMGREPVFANPALLNLTMPTLWESGSGSLEFVAMAPTGVLVDVLMGGGNPSTGGFTVGGMRLFDNGPNPFDNAADAFQALALNAEGDLTELDVGGRPVDAWRLRASAPLEAVYVDGSGSIVRLDLPADQETGERYRIRRLRPSEY